MDRLSIKTEADLAEFVAGFYDDPYGFVMAMWPWGQNGTADGSFNVLHNKKGPEPWQAKLLKDVGKHIRLNGDMASFELDLLVWRSAVASGHGVGKSAIVAWLIYFFMSTRPDTRGVVTASTQFQLNDKTWPELAKWHSIALNSHWFQWEASSFYFKLYPEDKRKNYMFSAATVSEHKTEAFAGLHNEGKSVVVIFDEASGVLPKIWEVAEGALTDGEAFFFGFGNPTQATGEFRDCFDKHKRLYKTMHVDSREVSHTNKNAIRHIIAKYGEDSDAAKVRVYGQFPDQSHDGFIGKHIVDFAQTREIFSDPGSALIMGVDVARFGDDESCIAYRQGRDARSIKTENYSKLDNVKLASVVMQRFDKYKPDALIIEGVGVATGVIDILRFRGYPVIEVYPGAPSKSPEKYINKRVEWWHLMREWLFDEGGIDPDDKDLAEQLTQIRYTMDSSETKIKLESKKEMKERQLPSPDRADALSLTFAAQVARRDVRRGAVAESNLSQAVLHGDPLESELGI